MVCTPMSSHMTLCEHPWKRWTWKYTKKFDFPAVHRHHLPPPARPSLPLFSSTPPLLTLSQGLWLSRHAVGLLSRCSHGVIITAGYNWKQESPLLGCMVTWVSVSSDIPTLANFLPHLHSTERRQESVTADMDSDSLMQTGPSHVQHTADHNYICLM